MAQLVENQLRPPRRARRYCEAVVLNHGGVILSAPGGLRYLLGVTNDGAVFTSPSPFLATVIVLIAPDGSRYYVRVDDYGALYTEPTADAGVTTVILIASDQTRYRLQVMNDASLVTQAA